MKTREEVEAQIADLQEQLKRPIGPYEKAAVLTVIHYLRWVLGE